MCLIIDINIGHRVLSRDNDPDFCDIHKALFGPGASRIRMIYGGKLAREYTASHELARLVLALDRAGRAIKIDDDRVDEETDAVDLMGVCVSNDTHIIALARVSGTRILCSHDQNLHADFTDKRLIDKPRGKVYQNQGHNNLLRSHCR